MAQRPLTTRLTIEHPLPIEHLATAAAEEPVSVETVSTARSVARFLIDFAGTALHWIVPAGPGKRGPKSAKTREKIKQRIKELGPAHPGNLTREQWIEKLDTTAGTYDRALREHRSEMLGSVVD
jgi:hypothetical protein